METEPFKTPPPVSIPTTIESLVTHFSYMRRDMEELKVNQMKSSEEIKRRLDDLGNGFVTLHDYSEHIKQYAKHIESFNTLAESVADYSTVKKIVYGCVSLILVAFFTSLVYLVIPR